jgi:zinc protease
MLLSLSFGRTSPLYKRLVQDEQKVDQLFDFTPNRVDPTLATIGARVKKPADALYVRDAILQTVARLRDTPVTQGTADAKSAQKYGLIRTLDNTEQIASTLASYVHFNRSYGTLNRYYRLVDSLTPADLQAAARKYLVDDSMVVTTLAHEALPAGSRPCRSWPSWRPPRRREVRRAGAEIGAAAGALQAAVRGRFRARPAGQGRPGGAHRGDGRIEPARRAQDRRSHQGPVPAGRQLLRAGRQGDDDLQRLDPQGQLERLPRRRPADAAGTGLPRRRLPPPEGRAKERAAARPEGQQRRRIRQGAPAGECLRRHAVRPSGAGHLKGIESITLDDVKAFYRQAYTQGALRVGISGDVSEAMTASAEDRAGRLPAGAGLPAHAAPQGRKPNGLEVEIIEKNTRATAISFGLPMAVTRSHPDFPALWLAKTWLGEHRASSSHLYQQIRELRGMNYGDYAYIEAFPRGMFQFFPSPNLGRKAQLFEVWIRPVAPQNAHFALRLALVGTGQAGRPGP